jgi:hypothetical protein
MIENSYKLKKKIDEFNTKFLSKDEIIIFEENRFDIIIGKSFNLAKKIILITFKIFLNIFMKITEKFLDFLTQQGELKKKIQKQEEILLNNAKMNSMLAEQISLLNKKIENIPLEKNLKKSNEEEINLKFDNDKNESNTKQDVNVEFYQNENLRLSKELYDVQNKAIIMKEEIEKFENQRANLVAKINSVNDVIKDSNVLTNVFENSFKKDQIKIQDYKIEQKKNIKKDLSQEVKKIFSNT